MLLNRESQHMVRTYSTRHETWKKGGGRCFPLQRARDWTWKMSLVVLNVVGQDAGDGDDVNTDSFWRRSLQ